MNYQTAIAAAAALGVWAMAAGAQAQDAAAGEKTFQMRCAVCHTKTAAGGPMAPSLRGVVGAKAASKGWDKYSPALKSSGKVWTAANLDAFLAAPAKTVPGTKMIIALPNANDRKAVIAYLETLK